MASVKDGVVTAQKEGTATVTVMTSNKKTASCAVTVTKAVVQNPVEVPVRSVKLNKTKLTLGLKEKFALKATVAPKQATAKGLKFESSSRKVASVDQKGAVTAKKTGKALITVKAGGKTATCAVTVKAAPKKISLNARTKTLKKGKTFQVAEERRKPSNYLQDEQEKGGDGIACRQGQSGEERNCDDYGEIVQQKEREAQG